MLLVYFRIRLLQDNHQQMDVSNPSPPESEDEDSLIVGAGNEDFSKALRRIETEEPVEWLYGQKFLRDEPVGAMERDFYCATCKSMMNSECTWIKHVMGKRHIKKYAALNHVPIDRETLQGKKRNIHSLRLVGGPSMVRTKTLDTQSLIQNVIEKYSTPLIGLNFVIEVRLMERGAEPIYQCTLCPADCQMTTILNHVGGYRHRMSYLKLCNRRLHDVLHYSTQKKSLLSQRVEKIAATIEKEDGMGKMIIEQQVSSVTESVTDETLDIEKCVPQLPKSTFPICIKKATDLTPSKRVNLLSLWVKSFLQQITIKEDQISKLDSVGNVAKLMYQKVMWSNLAGEKREQSRRLLSQQRFGEYMEEVFCMKAVSHGSILRNVVQQVAREREKATSSMRK